MEFRPIPDCRLYLHSLERGAHAFVVVSMFTPEFRAQADRLAASISQLGLPFALYEIPAVHTSTSPKGIDEIAFSKANFINWTLLTYGCPVLYVDADVVFSKLPSTIPALRQNDVDFACYNWLADESTDAYRPTPVTLDGTHFTDRFYTYSHAVDSFDATQLMSSGPVQYYSVGSLSLLLAWLNVVNLLPTVPDDQSLDYAHNFVVDRTRLRTNWLGKEYCRYPWWPHVEPVIRHVGFPAPYNPARNFTNTTGKPRIDEAKTRTLPARGPFPRDCLIDTKDRVLFRLDAKGVIAPFSRFAMPLWLD